MHPFRLGITPKKMSVLHRWIPVIAALGTGALNASAGAEPAVEQNWPSFRGERASGVVEAEGPLTWDAETGANIAWKTPIPGLGLSSPVVWGDRIYLTTAVAESGEAELKVGLYGDVLPSPDEGPQSWRVLCLNRSTGEILWDREVHRGKPQVRRHPKASHANCTVATDGRHVVSFFGSEGMFCLNLDGEVLWSKSFGLLDSGYFRMKTAQWGFASSPIIHGGRVLLQCDVQEGSFIAALDVGTGETIWRTSRDEAPTWGCPTIYVLEGNTRVAVNGYKHIGAYDFETGEEVWKLEGGGDIPVPTPVVAHDLIFITNAHGSLAPIYAVKIDARGTLDPEAEGEGIAWWRRRGGNYMQTPIVLGDFLFCCADTGVISCYDAKTGNQHFRERLRQGQSGFGFTASPVSDGKKIYYATEDGYVFVVKAAPALEILAQNGMGESCMASPALTGKTLLVRTRHHLVAIREPP